MHNDCSPDLTKARKFFDEYLKGNASKILRTLTINQVDGSNPFVQKCKDITDEFIKIKRRFNGNSAYSEFEIDGLGWQELKAVSGKTNAEGFCNYIDDINSRSFKSHFVGSETDILKPIDYNDLAHYPGRVIYDRAVDTEFKILDNIDRTYALNGSPWKLG